MPPISAIITQDLSQKFGNQAGLAKAIGVDRAAIGRWIDGKEPTEENIDKLLALELVMTRLSHTYQPSTAQKWLMASNPFLGHRKPVDLISDGRISEVIVALEAAQTGGYL